MSKVKSLLSIVVQLVIIVKIGFYYDTTFAQNISFQNSFKNNGNSDNYAPDRVIVRFKNTKGMNKNTLRSNSNTTLQSMGVTHEKRYTFSNQTSLQSRSSSGLTNTTSSVDLHIDILEIVDKTKSVKQVIKELEASGMVEYAEPDYTVTMDTSQSFNYIPNDPLLNDQWSLHNIGQTGGKVDADIDALETFLLYRGRPSIVVGVIDTGVDYTHPDLVDNMWVNPGEIPGNGIDDDANGYIDDIHGIDTINDDSDPMDDNSHGTHVAGTIGATANNNIGVVGIDWSSRIMALKFINNRGNGLISGAIECLNYVVMMKNRGVDIRLTNNSWGGHEFSQAMSDAILASQKLDMLFIASAGNAKRNVDFLPHYPSSYDLNSIISVASTDHNDKLSTFSNYGINSVDIAAPGSKILSTLPENSYGYKSGTSMASPHVSGVASILWYLAPYRTAQQIKNLILYQADPIDHLNARILSGARLNLNKAISCVYGTAKVKTHPLQDNFVIETENLADTRIEMFVTITDCGNAVNSAIIDVTVNSGDQNFQLLDNGIAPDAIANDGVYSGIWNPKKQGLATLHTTVKLPSQTIRESISGKVVVEVPKYAYHDFPYQWIRSLKGKRLSISSDINSSIEIPIGFDFKFYGKNHDSIKVSTNGLLSFGDINGSERINYPISHVETPNNIIAPYWDDFNPSYTGDIYSLLEGNAPKRRLTITWRTISRYPNDPAISFQATLYEGSNDIVFQYEDVHFNGGGAREHASNGRSATVGIKSNSGNKGLQYSYNEDALRNYQAILFTYHDSITLPNNVTIQFSLPKDPGLKSSVADIFGGILDMNPKNLKTWQISEFDPIEKRHLTLTPASTLSQGKGYYIQQITGSDLNFTMTGTPTPTISKSQNPNCLGIGGCFEIELSRSTDTNQTYLIMIGHPFEHKVYWRDVRIEVDGITVCTPAQAQKNNLLLDRLEHFDGIRFIYQDSTDKSYNGAALEPYKGYWLRLFIGSKGKSVKLLIPKAGVYGKPSC